MAETERMPLPPVEAIRPEEDEYTPLNMEELLEILAAGKIAAQPCDTNRG
jgi:hypothetical protein